MSIVENALNAQRRRMAEAAAVAGVSPSPARAASTESPAEGRRVASHVRIGLDARALRAAGALPPENSERQFEEQYRRIKRPLVDFAQSSNREGFREKSHLVVVTSSFPAEGKTFTSLNLALSLAQEKDFSAVLIDADIANPRLTSLLSHREEPGLFDALYDHDLDIEQLIVDTDIPGFSFLGAGRRREGSAELLASSRMDTLMATLVGNDPHRLVILDSPPLLLTSESRELTSVAGQIVLVVRADRTPQESVLEAIGLIPDGKHVGVVLNQVDPGSPDVTYYGYGRYGSYKKELEKSGSA